MDMSQFEPRCLGTAGGAMCHTDVVRACQVILDNFPEIPFLPAFPNISYIKGALLAAEGMPCLKVDEEKKRIYFDTSKDLEGELARFYEKYLADDLDALAVTPKSNPGFHYMLEVLKRQPPSELKMVKLNFVGPVTFMIHHVDENNKPIFYNKALREAIIKALAMKVRWLEKRLRESFPGLQTMVQMGEPTLGMYGSAFLNLTREEVLSNLAEITQVISGLSGIHCCGNTDWPLLMESGVTFINFDAYEYFDRISLYPNEIRSYLEKGGILAWGIVPVTDAIARETPETLVERLEASMDLMVQRGIDKKLLLERSLIMPSCVTGSMTVPEAEKVYAYTSIVAKTMRHRYFNQPE